MHKYIVKQECIYDFMQAINIFVHWKCELCTQVMVEILMSIAFKFKIHSKDYTEFVIKHGMYIFRSNDALWDCTKQSFCNVCT